MLTSHDKNVHDTSETIVADKLIMGTELHNMALFKASYGMLPVVYEAEPLAKLRSQVAG